MQPIPEWLGAEAVRDLAEANFPLPRIELGSGLLADLPLLVGDYGRLAIVGDSHTFAAAPFELEGTRILLTDPHADEATARSIIKLAQECDFILAVGSGTINDLCKYASAQMGIGYGIVATAASMNGYASANASITIHGHKKTVPAQLPAIIICDLDVIAKAPIRLTRSGLGDMLCRPSVQTDWLCSHLLLGTPYDDRPFGWLEPFEQKLLAQAELIGQADQTAIQTLMQALILSGLAMSFCGGSYPASQGEHMIAHTMEMAYGSKLPVTYHGEQIGVTTLYMLQHQEQLLNLAKVSYAPENPAEIAQLEALLGPDASRDALAAYRQKTALCQDKPIENWEKLREQLRALHTNSNEIERALREAGCATSPRDLGWNPVDFDTAFHLARYTRERFTFLDLV